MKRIKIFLSIFILPVIAFGQTEKDLRKTGLTFSIPWGNYFYYYDYYLKHAQDIGGIGGIGLSVFYRLGKNRIASYSGLIGAADGLEHFGVYAGVSAIFSDILYYRNIYKQHLYIAGGASFVNHLYALNVRGTDSIPEYTTKDKTIGLSAGFEYQVFKGLGAAVFYRPSLIAFNHRISWQAVSMEVNYSIQPVKRRKK